MKTKKTNPNRINKSQLSRLAGISRTTVGRYLLSGDAPRARRGLYDKAEALQFLRTHVATPGRSPELKRLRTRKLELEILKVAQELDQSRGRLVDFRVTVIPGLAYIVQEFQALLRQRFESELPPRYVGKTWVECQLMNQEAIDLTIRAFKQGIDKLIASHAELPSVKGVCGS